MILRIGENVLNIDIERTRMYFEQNDQEICDCLGCKNYQLFAQDPGDKLDAFFSQFGLKMANVIESTALESEKKETLSYYCFYHLCGEIIHEASEDHVDDNMQIRFKEEKDLMAENFPQPSLQMDLWFDVPWILADKNVYYIESE